MFTLAELTSRKELIRMTLEKAFAIAKTYPIPEQQKVINFVMSIKAEKPKRTDIADSGLDFGPEYTDENHDERVEQFFALSEGIEIDEQAIMDLREASMI